MEKNIEIMTADEVIYETHEFFKYERKSSYNRSKNLIEAPLPALIVEMNVKKGQKVKKGEILLKYEAMKMYNPLLSPKDGTVEEVFVKVGEKVKKQQTLLKLMKD